MGQSESKSEYGGMFIQTDLPYCVSGTNITGKIYIQIYKQFPVERLILKIKGKEKCKWIETRTRTVGHGEHQKIETYEVKFDENHCVFDFNQVIYTFNEGWIPPGQYVYPFSFVLPKECPASAYYTGSNRAVAYIKYSCKGIFDAADYTKIKDIKYKWRLVVRQVPNVIHENLFAEQEKVIYKCWCCWSLGKSHFKCLFEKNSYTSIETAKALVSMDNTNCKAKWERVVFNLKQIVTLNADGHQYSRSNTILSKSFPGVDPYGNIDNQPLQINLAESKQSYQNHMHDDIKPLSEDDLKLAEFIQPTTTGRCVKIQYELEILQDYEGVCCSESPRWSLLMFLQPPQLPSYGLVATPAGWNPVVYNVVVCNVPNQIYYQTVPQAPVSYQNQVYPQQNYNAYPAPVQGGQYQMEGGSLEMEESKEIESDD